MRARRRPVLPMPITPSVRPRAFQPLKCSRGTALARAQGAVGLRDVLGERQHHRQRVLGHGVGIGARLVDHEHARRGARRHVHRVVARTARRHREKVGAAREQRRAAAVFLGQLLARRGDAVHVRGGQGPPVVRLRRVVGQPVEGNIGLLLEPVGDVGALAVFEPDDGLAGSGVGHGRYDSALMQPDRAMCRDTTSCSPDLWMKITGTLTAGDA